MINPNLPPILYRFRDTACQMSTGATTLPLEVFTQRNFVADFFSTEVEFYWHKQRYRVFVPPFGGLTNNVHGSSMARWIARGRLPIGDNWTFSLAITVEALWADIGWNCAVWKGVGHFERKSQGERGVPHQRFLAVRKLESLSYRMLKKLPKISTAWVECTNVTDRQTDDIQTDDRRICDSI